MFAMGRNRFDVLRAPVIRAIQRGAKGGRVLQEQPVPGRHRGDAPAVRQGPGNDLWEEVQSLRSKVQSRLLMRGSGGVIGQAGESSEEMRGRLVHDGGNSPPVEFADVLDGQNLAGGSQAPGRLASRPAVGLAI